MAFFYILLLLSIPVVLSFLLCKNKDKGGTLPPGPLGFPIIGNLLQIDVKAPHLYFFELSKKYGPLMSLRLGLRPALVVSSSSLAKEAFKTHDLEFSGRPPFLSWRRLSYNGLDLAFSDYGPYWREIRKLCVVNLFNAKRAQTFRSVREEEVRRMIRKIQTKSSSSDNHINLSTLTISYASSLICKIALGNCYEDGKSSVDEATKFHSLMNESDSMFSTCFFSDYIPFTGWVDRLRGQRSRLDKCFEEFDRFYQQIIDDHRDARRTKTEGHVEDIIDVMLRLKKDSYSINISHNHIKAVLMNIFLAGSGTNASTLVWAMTSLMKHPRAMQNVKKEIEYVCGEKDFVKEEDIERLSYLRAVIKETWRMFPPVPLLVPRETIQRCKLNGSEIQPKTLVYFNAWAIGRDPEAWEEPEKFQPERFLDSPIDYKGQHYEFIPFGAGRRICPGLHLGAASVELALANLLHTFNWELPAGMKRKDVDTTGSPGITVHKKVPLVLVAKSSTSNSRRSNADLHYQINKD